MSLLQESKVLIVGAGPTGLMLAAQLARYGVPFRLIDQRAGPSPLSRAIAVQARTLELLDQFGLADEAVALGHPAKGVNFYANGHLAARVPLGHLGAEVSPYPYVLLLSQDQTERILREYIEMQGGQVEWGTTLSGLEQNDAEVTATLVQDGRSERVQVTFVAGCDGSHSAVRQALGVQFAGGAYEDLFFVADTRTRGLKPQGELHVFALDNMFYAFFPLDAREGYRIVGLMPDTFHEPSFENVRADLEARQRVVVREVDWFATYRVHHRVARHFQMGRSFLLGDAAHVHSPAGGQGMNTGLGDAANLGWKLAAVLRGADITLLDSYERERQPFARTLVRTTDRTFQFIVSRRPLEQWARAHLVPALASRLMQFPTVQREAFRRASQIGVSYRRSPLSVGRAGSIHAGDRLPWAGDNFAALRNGFWHLFCYGQLPSQLRSWASKRLDLDLHVYPLEQRTQRVGYREGAVYLVRPDGYIGFCAEQFEAKALEQYLEGSVGVMT